MNLALRSQWAQSDWAKQLLFQGVRGLIALITFPNWSNLYFAKSMDLTSVSLLTLPILEAIILKGTMSTTALPRPNKTKTSNASHLKLKLVRQ